MFLGHLSRAIEPRLLLHECQTLPLAGYCLRDLCLSQFTPSSVLVDAAIAVEDKGIFGPFDVSWFAATARYVCADAARRFRMQREDTFFRRAACVGALSRRHRWVPSLGRVPMVCGEYVSAIQTPTKSSDAHLSIR